MHDLRDAVSFHQLLLSANGASEHTNRLYRIYQLAFLEYLDHKRLKPDLAELNPQRVLEFLTWYRNQPREHRHRTRGGEAAVRTASGALKRLGAVLVENNYFTDNPLEKMARPRRTKYVRTPFSAQEVNAMWGACFRTQDPARDEALFLLLLDTGARIGEVCSLRIDKIDFEGRTVTFMGKGRRERIVPIGDGDKRDGGRMVRALRRCLQLRRDPRPAGEPYVFLSRAGTRLTSEGGYEAISRIAVLGSVEGAYPHRLRHTFCTWYLTVYPGDELGLRRIVGHLSKDVLADYVHFSQNTIAQRAGRASLAETWLGNARPAVALSGSGSLRAWEGSGLAGQRREQPASVAPDQPIRHRGSRSQ